MGALPRFGTQRQLITTIGLVITIILSGLCGISTEEESLKFKHQVYETSTFCPNLLYSNIERKSSFQLVKHWLSPCLLKSSDQQRVALIAGIHADSKPWKCSSDSKTCKEHIKVPLPKPHHPANNYHDLNMICKVPRTPESFVKFNVSNIDSWFLEFVQLGMNYRNILHPKNPSLYDLGNRKLVISIPSFNRTHFNDSDLVFNEQRRNNWFQQQQPDHIHHSWTKYIQIIFIVRTAAGDCNVQIQQYSKKCKKEMSCEHLQELYPFRLCGVYGCDKIRDILSVVGFQHFYDHSFEKTRQIPKTHQPARPTTTTPTPIMKPFIANKIMMFSLLVWLLLIIRCVVPIFRAMMSTSLHDPILSSGGSRSQIGNYNNNSRNVTLRPPATTTVAMVVTSHNVIPIPLVQMSPEEEPPPSYDCLDKLPTYEEAITL